MVQRLLFLWRENQDHLLVDSIDVRAEGFRDFDKHRQGQGPKRRPRSSVLVSDHFVCGFSRALLLNVDCPGGRPITNGSSW